MNSIVIAPSILSLDYPNVSAQLEILKESKAEWLHFDVMDGHFVPNLTFGPDILRGFKKACPLFMDVHLMVEDPETYAPIFIKNGADLVTFHTEALNNALENKKSNDIVYLEKPLDIYIDKNFYTKLQDGIFQKVDDLISEVLKTKVYISADTLKEKTVVSVAGEIPLQSINTDLDLFTLINKLYDENS